MSGRALGGLFVALAILVAGGAGYALFHDEGETAPSASGRPGSSGGNGTQAPPLSPAPVATRTPGTFTQPSPAPSPAASSGPTASSAPADAPIKRADKITTAKPGKGGGLIVVALTPDGMPLAGAIVDAGTPRRHLSPRPTNLSGEAALDPVAPDDGKITGSVRHVRFAQAATFTADPGSTRVSVKFAGEEGGTGFLVGTIHTAQGSGPAHVELEFFDDQGLLTTLPSEAFLQFASNGQFRVEVAPGSYTVAATAPGYTESDKGYAMVHAGRESTPVDLLIQAAGTISGHVTLPPDLQARRGPVHLGFDLECVTGTKDNPNTVMKHVDQEVGDDGSFKLDGLQPGSYRVRATDSVRVSAWATAQLGEGTQVQLNLGLAENSATTVRGTVRDMLGQPVAGASVKGKLASGRSDSSGNFELRGLDPGRQELVVEQQGYVRRVQTIDVPSPGAVAVADVGVITLPRCGSATGVVTSGGKPAAGVSVLAVEKQPGGSISPHGPATTDASGAWRLEGLNPGAYYLKVGGGDAFDDANAPRFQVRSGEVVAAPSVDVPSPGG